MAEEQPPEGVTWEQLMAALIALYIETEQQLLGGITSILRGIPVTDQGRVDALGRMRRLVALAVERLRQGNEYYSSALVRRAIDAGAKRGDLDAQRAGLPPVPPSRAVAIPGREPFDFSIRHGDRAVQAIRDDLVSPLDDVRRRLTRLPDDVYKLISPAGSAGLALGRGYTPQQAQAYVWREYVRQGVNGFTDRSGREWSLSAYVEMSVRTTAMRAYNDSHLQRIEAAGSNLVIVSDTGHPCPKCFPWQNRVLCIRPDGIHPTTGDAIAGGLMHPNCKHLWTIYVEGVTQLPAPREWTPLDEYAYRMTQKQRRLELAIRKAKKAREYALTPTERRDADRAIFAAQRDIRDFLDSVDMLLLRQSRREQVDLANDRIKLPAFLPQRAI